MDDSPMRSFYFNQVTEGLTVNVVVCGLYLFIPEIGVECSCKLILVAKITRTLIWLRSYGFLFETLRGIYIMYMLILINNKFRK